MTTQIPVAEEPIFVKKRGISFIWILPIIAACIGGWLMYKSISEAGIPITVTLDNAEGLEVGKTKLMYKGIEISKIEEITVNEDIRSISLHFDIPRQGEKYLNSNTQFWLVKPRISLSGVSGLNTLLSGNYIELKPQMGGERTRTFTALPQAPHKDSNDPGLILNLHADLLGSLAQGAPIYFRQIKVGEIQGHRINDQEDGVIINAYIEEPYKHLVRQKTRFWNASGVRVEGGLSGFKISTESLSALMSGGIAFYTPKDSMDCPLSLSGDEFTIYKNFDAAESGIPVTLNLESSAGLKQNSTLIMLDGIEIGLIKKIRIKQDLSQVVAHAEFDPRARPILNSGSLFWRVKPRFGLTGISDLSTIITGEYITVQPGKGEEAYEFDVLEEPPILSKDTPGLHFQFRAKDKGSIVRDTRIMYKKVTVGHVEACTLDEKGEYVIIDAFIEPQYARLVKENSRFWDASGLELKGSMNGFKLKTESATSILLGGISFFTPKEERQYPVVRNDALFTLYKDFDEATENGILLKEKTRPGLLIEILTTDLASLTEGSHILYNRVKVGEVDSYSLDRDGRHVRVKLLIEPQFSHLVHRNSLFWNASGIKISGGLSGIRIRSESIKTLLNGGLSFYTPKPSGEQAINGDIFKLFPDRRSAQRNGFPIQIAFTENTGVKPGAVIKYNDIEVGVVKEVTLREDGKQGVNIEAELYGNAEYIARTKTKFWVVGPALGLTKTKNLETLITGRYLEVKPGEGNKTTQFTGQAEAPIIRPPGLNISVVSERLGSIKIDNPVYYRQIPVGKVIDYALSDVADKVIIHLNIEPQFTSLVHEDSQFWNASGINVKAGIFSGVKIQTESIESIVAGGIAFATPPATEKGEMSHDAKDGHIFSLYREPKKEWFKWSPKISLLR